MSETIEERATRITKSIRKYLDEWADDGVMDYYPVESLELIKDLMAERGKKEEALKALEERVEELLELSEDIELIRLTKETLQRARDALRWIPCEERLPEKYDVYEVTEELNPGEFQHTFCEYRPSEKTWYDIGDGETPEEFLINDNVRAWREHLSAYTPEEK